MHEDNTRMQTKSSPTDHPAPANSQMLPPIEGDSPQSYLLRLWHGGGAGGRADDRCWRASLQSVKTGERHMFADLETLLAFLVDQTTHLKRNQ